MRIKLPFHRHSRRTDRSRRSRRRFFEPLEDRRMLFVLPAGFTENLVTTNSLLDAATAMDFSPTGQLWALEQGGGVKLIRNDGSSHTALSLTVNAVGERGMLGITFDPAYDGAGPNTDYVYLYYTAPRTGPTDPPNNRLSRFTVTGAGTPTPTLSSQLILRDLPPEDEDNNPATDGDSNHNGGAIHFGPDNKIYVAVGDHNYDTLTQSTHVSQILTTPFGKILRLNSDGTNPSDNPFFTGSLTDWQGSILAMGLRNPYTFAFDPGSGKMFINDVGEGAWEEINLGELAANYGWAGSFVNLWEGFESPPPPWANYRDPLMAYDHSDSPPTPAGIAITGGAFYPANSQFGTDYAGKYFFADVGASFIRVFDPANAGTPTTPDTSTAFESDLTTILPVDLKVDSAGNLYYLARDFGIGEIHRISRIDGPKVVDDGDAGFSLSGDWISGYSAGRDKDFNVALDGAGAADVATWTSSVSPGRYRVSATWIQNATSWATQAPFTVLDGATVRGTGLINQRQAPNDFVYAGSSWEDVGVFDITGSTLLVRLTSNGANGYVAADAIRIERLGDLPATAEMQVTEGINDVPDGAGSVSFGTVAFGQSATRTFVISNTGLQPLNLTGPVSVPPGYTLITPPALTTLNLGQSTTFVVRLDGSISGVNNGQISIANDDSDENPFNFNITGTVQLIRFLDNGQPGFDNSLGAWTTAASSANRDGDVAYTLDGNAVATWTFTGVTPGRYRISTTWVANASLWTTNARYSVHDETIPRGARVINQRQAPNDLFDDGTSWEHIGDFDITRPTLAVNLSMLAVDGYLIADAIRIERLGDLPTTAEVQVTEGVNDVPDNSGNVSFGTVELSQPTGKTFIISNSGALPLNLTGPILLPPGYTLIVPPALTTLTQGQATSFTVRLDAALPGTYPGQISFANDDSDENPFNFNITGTVLATRILDDGQPGYVHNGLFVSGANPANRDGDVSYAVGSASPSQASWTFTVPAGQYRVAATWIANATHWASNAPFTILNGATPLATVPINQRQPPDDFLDAGSNWEYVGDVFNISGSTLVVQLSNVGANGYVIADAIRIERIGDLNGNSVSSSGSPVLAASMSDSPTDEESPRNSNVELLATAFSDQELDDLAIALAEASDLELDTLADDLVAAGRVSDLNDDAIDTILSDWLD